ncbi:hypothetical protein D3C85_1515980 [compost metagenome]
MPAMYVPIAMPWLNVASREPPIKAISQIWRLAGLALKRNSNATPRKINPASMNISGRYNASRITE